MSKSVPKIWSNDPYVFRVVTKNYTKAIIDMIVRLLRGPHEPG